jgi:hypothetical protein
MIPGYERRAMAWGAPGMVFHYVGFVLGFQPLHRGATLDLVIGLAGFLGTIALGIGFGLYAKGKGRAWAWSLLALFGFLGLVALMLLQDRAVNAKPPESGNPPTGSDKPLVL